MPRASSSRCLQGCRASILWQVRGRLEEHRAPRGRHRRDGYGHKTETKVGLRLDEGLHLELNCWLG